MTKPTTKGSRTGTRDRILDQAERLILDNGYAATSVDSIIDAVGITKGAFFYHFKTKEVMARSLVERNARLDLERLDEYAARARNLASDPLQSFLVFLGLYIELGDSLTEPSPGCLFASFSYESGQFGDDVTQEIRRVILVWRRTLAGWLREAAAEHPPVQDFDADSLADLLTVVFEGALIVARSTRETRMFADQLRHYRSYVKLLFGMTESTA